MSRSSFLFAWNINSNLQLPSSKLSNNLFPKKNSYLSIFCIMHFFKSLSYLLSGLAVLQGSEAAIVGTRGTIMGIAIGTKFTQATLNALHQAGVTNIPLDLAGAVHDDLFSKFGGGAMGEGLLTNVRYTERALQAGAQGFFSVIWNFASSQAAANAANQIRSYAENTYKRSDEEDEDLFTISGLHFGDLPSSAFSPEGAFVDKSVLTKRDNTVCFNPSGYSFTRNVFDATDPATDTNFNECESCQGGTRNGC